jgi:hypothetical protein
VKTPDLTNVSQAPIRVAYQPRAGKAYRNCAACQRPITSGQRYHDGGENRRVHTECVDLCNTTPGKPAPKSAQPRRQEEPARPAVFTPEQVEAAWQRGLERARELWGAAVDVQHTRDRARIDYERWAARPPGGTTDTGDLKQAAWYYLVTQARMDRDFGPLATGLG